MTAPYPSDYEEWDRFRMIWEPDGWRIVWRVVDMEGTVAPNGPAEIIPEERENRDGRVHFPIIATGKAWSLRGARRKAFDAMRAERAWEEESPERTEPGGLVAFKTDADAHADRAP